MGLDVFVQSLWMMSQMLKDMSVFGCWIVTRSVIVTDVPDVEWVGVFQWIDFQVLSGSEYFHADGKC